MSKLLKGIGTVVATLVVATVWWWFVDSACRAYVMNFGPVDIPFFTYWVWLATSAPVVWWLTRRRQVAA